jgi:hypothetical protein
MNNVSHVAQHVSHHEHGQRYNSHMPAHSAYRAPVAQYPPYEPSGESRTAASRDAKVSPTSQARLPALDSAVETQSRQHKPNHNAIAPSFQIPKSVNDSGGSLSELAAEVSLCTPNDMTKLFIDKYLDHMPFLVRIIGPSPTNRGFANLSATAQEVVQGRHTNNRLPQMGHHNSFNHACGAKRGSPGIAIRLPLEEAESRSQGKARQ